MAAVLAPKWRLADKAPDHGVEAARGLGRGDTVDLR
jgi:hypothetical protein